MMTTSQLAQIFFGKDGEGSLRNRLARAATGTFGLKVAATGLSFVSSMLLARLLGVIGYGAYSYAMAWVSLLGVLATFGLDQLLIRNMAAYQALSSWSGMSGLLRWADRTVLIVSSGLALLIFGVTWLLATHLDLQMLSALWVALFILPLITLVSLRRAAMYGLNHVIAGGLLEMLIRPSFFILLVGCAYLFVRERLSAPWAVGLHVIAMAVAFLIGTKLLHKNLPPAAREATPVYETRAWVRSALPLMSIGVMLAITNQTATLMLGTINDAEAVAVYNVAKRGAQLISFIMIAVNTAQAPIIASLYAVGDIQRLQRVITKSARIVLLVSLPVAVGLIAFGKWFLLLFGSDFLQGYVTLVILSFGQLIDAAAGSVGYLLIMTGHERDAAVSIGIRTMLTVLLNIMLIPGWGSEGAAAATAISLIAWNGLLVVWVYRRLGIHSTAIGRISLRSVR